MKFFAFLMLAMLGTAPAGLAQQVFHAGTMSMEVRPAAQRNWRGSQSSTLHCVLWYPADVSNPETEQTVALPGLPPMFYAGFAAMRAPLAHGSGRLPLIVMSHGLGGSADQFGWLAPELARHGYLVLAVNHPGNNLMEPYTPEGALLWGERALDVSNALDGLLADTAFGAHVDTARIGALGYSIGGETVLALAGARIDQPAFFDFCLSHPSEETCRIPSTTAAARSAADLLNAVRTSSAESLEHAGDSFRDARIRAVFAIAPAAGQAFHRSSFDYVSVPVTLVAGTADRIAPPETNAEQFASWMPSAKVAVMKGADHYTFLATCTENGIAFAPQYCSDPPTVSRDTIHQKTTAMALAFFDKTLKPAPVQQADAAPQRIGISGRIVQNTLPAKSKQNANGFRSGTQDTQ